MLLSFNTIINMSQEEAGTINTLEVQTIIPYSNQNTIAIAVHAKINILYNT
jgi:hypothetical protein